MFQLLLLWCPKPKPRFFERPSVAET